MKLALKTAFEKQAALVLALLLGVRLAGMALIPLHEVTEARYGEIARKMLETGDWVTLFHDYGVPFWAKPPLYAWLSAAAMGLFGVNEFAARLPSLLLSLGLLALVGCAAGERARAFTAVFVLASTLGFVIASGTVMTDTPLVFCTTLIMLSFWKALQDGAPPWRWLFFIGGGLGLLAKGPVALVLTGLPILLWVWSRGAWKPLWRKLPWVRGSLLTLVIAVPWYVLAELRTPGFLQYFLWGENIARFLTPGWKGDLYGRAHACPYGVIWLFALAALFPWSLFAFRWCRTRLADRDGWLRYLLLWCGVNLLFFTFAANIIWTYAMPLMPAFALLFAELTARTKMSTRFLPAAGFIMVLLSVACVIVLSTAVRRDSKDLIAAWQQTNPPPQSALLFWSSKREFSAFFYSRGRARIAKDPAALIALLHNGQPHDCIVSYTTNRNGLPPAVKEGFREVARVANTWGVRILSCED